MPLPYPEVEQGAVVVTFQANIDGYAPTTRTIPAAKVAKIMRAVAEIVEGYPPTPVYADLTNWFEKTMTQYQFRELDQRFPDAPSGGELVLLAQIRALQGEIDALKAANVWIK